jgi:hypothetical protein
MTTLYHLKSSTMSPCSMDKGEYAKALETWLCQGCASPKIGSGAIDVVLRNSPQKIPLNFVSGIGVGIVSETLLNALGMEMVEPYLLLGTAKGPDRRPIEGFRTFRGKHRMIIRGDERSSYRKCEVCGRDIYFPMGKKYIVGQIPDTPIYQSQYNQLIVTEELYKRISGTKWKKVSIEKLENYTKPLDLKSDFPMISQA